MKRIARVIRLIVLSGGLFFALGVHLALADFIFDLTGTAGPDGGTGQIDLTAPSGGLAQLGSFNFTNKSFLASSVPGGITYQYGTNDVSSLSYSISGSVASWPAVATNLTLGDLSTNVISGTLPAGVDPGIGNHIVFGSQGGALPVNGFASGSHCNNPGPQGCSAFFQGTSTALNITRFTLADVLGGSVQHNTASTMITSVGGGMAATFTPNLGLSLQDAARVIGVDHFNWVQIVIGSDVIPLNWRINGSSALFPILPRVPFIDPPLGGYAYQGFNQDNRIGYLDEVYHWSGGFSFSLPVGNQPTTLTQFTKLNQFGKEFLQFRDSPCLGAVGDRMQFLTFLGAFDAAGNLVPIPLGGLGFRWSYTAAGGLCNTPVPANVDPTLGNDGVITPEDGPLTDAELQALASLGLAAVDAEFMEPTPEPTTLFLWGTTVSGLGIASRWRRRRQK